MVQNHALQRETNGDKPFSDGMVVSFHNLLMTIFTDVKIEKYIMDKYFVAYS
jgi:hypothetical protein